MEPPDPVSGLRWYVSTNVKVDVVCRERQNGARYDCTWRLGHMKGRTMARRVHDNRNPLMPRSLLVGANGFELAQCEGNKCKSFTVNDWECTP